MIWAAVLLGVPAAAVAYGFTTCRSLELVHRRPWGLTLPLALLAVLGEAARHRWAPPPRG